MKCKLEDYKIELVNADGTSFYPFIYLFNSIDKTKTLPIPLAILTDDDRFTESKNTEYSFKNIKDNLPKAEELFQKIKDANQSTRIDNIKEVIKSVPDKICLNYSYKTFEFTLVQSNIPKEKIKITENLLWKYLSQEKTIAKKFTKIKGYVDAIATADLTEAELNNLHILIWKALPSKAEFAQDLSVYLLANLEEAQENFIVPDYIQKAITHLTTYKAK